MNPLTLAAAAFGALGGLTATLARDLPSEQDLPVILTSPQVQVEARYLLGGAQDEYARHAVCRCGPRLSPDEIPPALKEALLAQEDTRFYVHRGIDWIGLVRAAGSVVSGGAVQGGSTLTQQLVKNLITGNARTGLDGVMRKVREAIVASRVERVMTKDEILAAYLNQMDFGSTDGSAAIGVVQAARKYFAKPVQDLTLYEAAMLVGTLRGTRRYNPIANPDAADQQARSVLGKMRDQERISPGAYVRALRQVYALPRGGTAASVATATGYYVAWARAELADIAAGRPAGARKGLLRYVVGLDPWHQAQGEAAVRDALERAGDQHVGQGALAAIDGDGRVDALVGGADFATSQFDRATQAKRQPGSAFKLFVYTAALNAGLSPDSIRPDAPVSVDGYAPQNADHKFRGPIPLSTAFAQSRNTVAVLLGKEVGVNAIINVAHELGVKSPLHPGPSLALGTSEVTLLELTSAYTAFMNDGRPVRPYAARMVLNARGEVIWRRNPTPLQPAVSARTLRAMRGMLREVVTEGTGRQARLRDRWSAGKTGTTQDNRDAWFIGFTDRLTTGVWFGNDDHSPMAGVAGAGMPALAWRGFNEAMSAHPFPESGGAAARGSAKTGVVVKPPLPRAAPEAAQRRSHAFAQGGLSREMH
jgi:penicillin-binding protein 1A